MYKTDPSNKQLYYCPSSPLNPFPISKSPLPHPHPILKSYPFSQTHPQTLPPSLDPTAIPMPFSYPQILLASLTPTPHPDIYPLSHSKILLSSQNSTPSPSPKPYHHPHFYILLPISTPYSHPHPQIFTPSIHSSWNSLSEHPHDPPPSSLALLPQGGEVSLSTARTYMLTLFKTVYQLQNLINASYVLS